MLIQAFMLDRGFEMNMYENVQKMGICLLRS